MRILFVDFSSAFNTIITDTFQNKLTALHPHLHLSVDHQLPDRQAAASEAGKILIQHLYDQHWSSSGLCSLHTALSSLDERLHIQRPLCHHTDDTTLIGLIQDGDESAYREEVKELVDNQTGAVLTTWSLTCSKLWRWSWTSGETPLLSPYSPSWTALWLQWSNSEWAKGLVKSLWTSHIQHTPSLNCYRLVDATELWASERPDTGTVSSLKQSISWILDIKHGTHNTFIHNLFITHTYFYFQICTYETSTHIIVYIIYCVFAFLYIVYLYICILFFIICVLSCCWHSVAL